MKSLEKRMLAHEKFEELQKIMKSPIYLKTFSIQETGSAEPKSLGMKKVSIIIEYRLSN